ncbi:FeoB small GTPase domain-containing protein [Metallibacterium scheffleri]|uniref:FeoB small GTPase domain-containing protein n=1 Tax=Metallibacterium scheffleri TaxID=993689 RepID=UPI00241270AB|nr:FeoB small GTPase domain-containing protein [Metallibacterium scheffleri]
MRYRREHAAHCPGGQSNCGKTALFNLLTGSRQKVANYAASLSSARKAATFRRRVACRGFGLAWRLQPGGNLTR